MNRGEKLKLLRKNKGLTQKQVLKDLNDKNKQIDKNTLSKAERNGNISNTTMEILAYYYGVSFDYLKNDEIDNNTNESIEINKLLGFSDITIYKIKELENKKNLNTLFENLNLGSISYDLRDIEILKKYYDIFLELARNNYDFIKSIDINTFENIYLFEDVIDTLKNIILNIQKGNKIHIEQNTLINFLNRINASIGYYKYSINKQISYTLDKLFDSAISI